jgi:hypothetical protein
MGASYSSCSQCFKEVKHNLFTFVNPNPDSIKKIIKIQAYIRGIRLRNKVAYIYNSMCSDKDTSLSNLDSKVTGTLSDFIIPNYAIKHFNKDSILNLEKSIVKAYYNTFSQLSIDLNSFSNLKDLYSNNKIEKVLKGVILNEESFTTSKKSEFFKNFKYFIYLNLNKCFNLGSDVKAFFEFYVDVFNEYYKNITKRHELEKMNSIINSRMSKALTFKDLDNNEKLLRFVYDELISQSK